MAALLCRVDHLPWLTRPDLGLPGAWLGAGDTHGLGWRESDVGIRQLFVPDPDGNVIELVERAG